MSNDKYPIRLGIKIVSLFNCFIAFFVSYTFDLTIVRGNV